VTLGRSSSDLSKAEMTDLIELIGAFGANHGVVFHDQESTQ
ncbi:recombination protein NinB, partial [Streptococcus pneumoniae]|nr:NinB family protein [Streptococcus pneumoniae]